MKKVFTIVFAVALIVAIFVPSGAFAQTNAIQNFAKEAILMAENGQVIYQHNATEKRPIASMTKLMTLICAYDAIDEGKVSLDDAVVVSSRAASMGGSQVFLDANSSYKMSNLLKSIIICSANDSCVAVAEHVCGSVEAFVDKMNQKASALKLHFTHFENCTGLPAVSQFSCAKDVATMLLNVIKRPHYCQCSTIWMEDFVHPSGRVTGMTNTNKLVRFYDGCDGGKTGYTNEAMHCLGATAKRGETRVVAVVVGAPDSKVRFKQVSDMFNFAFANYESKVYLQQGKQAVTVKVVGGKQKEVNVVAKDNLVCFGKKGGQNCEIKIDCPSQLTAPFTCGKVVGSASLVDKQGNVVATTSLVTSEQVQSKSFTDYVLDIVTSQK